MALANYSVWGDRLHEKQHVRDWYQCVTATNIRVKLSIVRTFMLTLASLSCGSLDLGTMARDESLLFLLILPLKCFSHVRVKHTERAYVWFTVLLYCYVSCYVSIVKQSQFGSKLSFPDFGNDFGNFWNFKNQASSFLPVYSCAKLS